MLGEMSAERVKQSRLLRQLSARIVVQTDVLVRLAKTRVHRSAAVVEEAKSLLRWGRNGPTNGARPS